MEQHQCHSKTGTKSRPLLRGQSQSPLLQRCNRLLPLEGVLKLLNCSSDLFFYLSKYPSSRNNPSLSVDACTLLPLTLFRVAFSAAPGPQSQASPYPRCPRCEFYGRLRMRPTRSPWGSRPGTSIGNPGARGRGSAIPANPSWQLPYGEEAGWREKQHAKRAGHYRTPRPSDAQLLQNMSP